MAHPSDPVETPPPYGLEREPSGVHAVCLHPELINVVRQGEKRRTPLAVAIISAAVVIVVAITGVLYSQGSAAGATAVRVEALERRASEDRAESNARAERQRQQDIIEEQRHTELIQALHAIDSRLGRLEARAERR